MGLPDEFKYLEKFELTPPVLVAVLVWLLSLPLVFYVIIPNLSYWMRLRRRREQRTDAQHTKEVVVVVLGDLGHSPRITYQAQSFLKRGYFVNVCGYLESQLPYFLYNENVSINEIKVIKNTSNLPYALFGIYKATVQVFELFHVLTSLIDQQTEYILIQNPPCLPLLGVVAFLKFAVCPKVKIIIDWHNLNYTILNLKFHNLNHPLVKLVRAYERQLGRKYADINLVVTEAMRNFLIRSFKFTPGKIVTVHDRPAQAFQPCSGEAEFAEILAAQPSIFSEFDRSTDKIVITSTSFTADEDFTVLVEGLKKLDDKLVTANIASKVFMIVTGKGPLKPDFLKMVASHTWKQIEIKDVWLEMADYPKVLRVADLGVSLHYSSSGLDLPMKIVDLFGSGVPVISMGYPVISELVKDGKNGLVMTDNSDSDEMAHKLFQVLYQDPNMLATLKQGAVRESEYRWDDEWDAKLGNTVKNGI